MVLVMILMTTIWLPRYQIVTREMLDVLLQLGQSFNQHGHPSLSALISLATFTHSWLDLQRYTTLLCDPSVPHTQTPHTPHTHTHTRPATHTHTHTHAT
jgi:hypothetical protein